MKPLLQSCVALGSSLLETYLPDGNRRPSSDRESDFKRKVESFFREASCSSFGREMFNKYLDNPQGSGNNNEDIFTRRGNKAGGSEIIFHKIDPTSDQATVVKTKVDPTETDTDDVVGENILDLAQDIINQDTSMRSSEKTSKEFPF